MEIDKIFNERYSVRKYSSKPVENDKIQQIINAGMKAPTGKNHQPQRIFVVKGAESMSKLKSVCKCTFDAPVALLVCYNENEAWHSRFEENYNCGEMDVTIVTTFMMLKAWELGIGSCWVRYFDSREVAKVFNLPEEIHPACILDLGYAAEDCKPLETMHNKPRAQNEVIKFI